MSLWDLLGERTAQICLGCGLWAYHYGDDHLCDQRYGPREVERVTPANLARWIAECRDLGYIESE